MTNQTLYNLIQNFSNENVITFMRNRSEKFTPSKESLADYNDDDFSGGRKLGQIRYTDVEELLVCSFKCKNALSERSGKKLQYEKAKKLLKEQVSDAGIFVFYDGEGNFRFSLVYADYAGKKRNWSTFKRFTYFVDHKANNKTFLMRVGEADFGSIDEIRDAFSVEKVTKEFYQEISYWYFWAVQKCRFPKNAEEKPNGRNEAVIRLITRMIFIWFMREKKLISRDIFDKQYVRWLLNDISDDESTYYLAILQNLFFATLSVSQEDRRFRAEGKGAKGVNSDYGNQYVYRHHKLFQNSEQGMSIFEKIPFLNGGLFECLDDKEKDQVIDGFTDIEKNQPMVPNSLFFGDEHEVDINSELGTKSKRYRVRGLLNLLSAYNFTIDENTPDDQDVALDPELLGRVFENLLASFNPETSTTARKATGSYYTPREIVDYMVTESLVAYFETKLKENEGRIQKGKSQFVTTQGSMFGGEQLALQSEQENEPRLRLLLSYGSDTPNFSQDEADVLIEAIDQVKVLDPACGSGAFPMGVLQKLVHVLGKLDPDNEKWKAIQLAKTKSDERRQEVLEAFALNDRDYGRKLYLIENCIYGVDIQPTATQISKLRFLISLLVDQGLNNQKPNLGIRALPNLEAKFVTANTLIGLKKPMQRGFGDSDIENKENELEEVRHQLYSAQLPEIKKRLRKKDKKIRGEIKELLLQSGWSSSSSNSVADWDPYDQTASAGFFEPGWMMGVQKGFDIVIGNPPYIDYRDIGLLTKQSLPRFKSYQHSKTNNIYVYFIELGLTLLKRDGILIFINPYAYLSSDSGFGLRKLIFDQYSFVKIVDVSNIDIFSSSTYTCINGFINRKSEDHKINAIKCKSISDIYSVGFQINPENYNNDKFRILLTNETSLINKISNETVSLGKLCEMFCGTSESGFGKLIINSAQLVSMSDEKKEEFNKIVQTSDISKYKLSIIDNYIPKRIYSESIQDAFRKPKILFARMTKVIRATFTEKPYCAGKINVLINFSIDPYYLLGVINSKLIDYWYISVNESKHLSGGYLGFDIPSISEIPIKSASADVQRELSELVRNLLKIQGSSNTEFSSDDIASSKIITKIDEIVYALYSLTDSEIRTIETEIKNILG